jgi:hypothetical protein
MPGMYKAMDLILGTETKLKAKNSLGPKFQEI